MKDKIFSIYRYSIRKTPKQLRVFVDENDEQQVSFNETTPEDLLDSLFPKKDESLSFGGLVNKSNTSKDEKKTYNNIVLEHKESIVVLQIQANKSKTITDTNWDNHQEPHHPYCLVIFDNRPGRRFVAIERSAMDTAKTAHILQESFNSKLQKSGYTIEMMTLIDKLPFMEAIYHIKEKLSVSITKVTFDFINNNREQRLKNNRFLLELTNWINQFAENGQISAEIHDDSKLEKIQKDLELMAELCSLNSNYHLLVKFRRFGLFRYGQDVEAQLGVNEEVLKRFIFAEYTMFDLFEDCNPITLPEWLDDVKKLYENYEEEKLSQKKYRRNTRY